MKSHMGLEGLIKEFTRRIKDTEESPGSKVLRADKMLAELAKERLQAQLDEWKRGLPSVDGPGHISRLFKAMGFTPTMYSTTGEYTPESFGKYRIIAERMGFPADKCCDKVVAQLAMNEIDTLPKPDAILVSGHGCDNDHKYYARMQADMSNVPAFFVDVPLNEDDKPNLANLNYITDQLGEFIEWAEKKVPGIKYDEARHVELLESDARGLKYLREIYQLVRHVPCPAAPMDVLGSLFTAFLPSRYPNREKAVEYLRMFRDELGDRVANGKGPYPKERLRLLWAGKTNELQSINPSKLFMERKVALPLSMVGETLMLIGLRGAPIGEVSEYGVKLSPLQEEAKTEDNSWWGGPGKRWINGALEAARDLGVHGIIQFNLIGCTPMRGMGSVVAERAEKELGIPTLNLEGRYLDRDYMSQERFEEILSAFIDKCFDWAGKPRQ